MKGILMGVVSAVIIGIGVVFSGEASLSAKVTSLFILTFAGGLAGYLVEMVYFLIFKSRDYLASVEMETRLEELLQSHS